MSRPPTASTAPAWFATAAPVNTGGPVVVGPTGVAVAEPLLVGRATVVPLPIEIEAPPVGPEPVEIGPTPVPEELGTVKEAADELVLAVVTVVLGVQLGRVKVPLKLPDPP